MNIINPSVLEIEIKRLIEDVKSAFQIDLFINKFEKKYKTRIKEISFVKGGKILVENNDIFFNLGLSVKLIFQLLINNMGYYVGFGDWIETYENDSTSHEQESILSCRYAIIDSERKAIRKIAEGIQIEMIRKLFKQESKINITGKICFENGCFAIYNNKLIYRLNYCSNLHLGITIDCTGKISELHNNLKTI
jgi:hypothetical protein